MNIKKKISKAYSTGEEIFNAVSHGIGSILGVAALTLLVIASALSGDPFALAASIIYGITFILLYTMSTLYHSLTPVKAKGVFKVLDHCSIYLLIAGTYTPFTLVTLNGKLGWIIFSVIWVFAILGILIEVFKVGGKYLGLACYIVMGWAMVFAIKPLVNNLETGGVVLLIAGGLCYTVGVIFYVMKRYRYTHGIWHLFVLGGSICHFLAILLYVIPPWH